MHGECSITFGEISNYVEYSVKFAVLEADTISCLCSKKRDVVDVMQDIVRSNGKAYKMIVTIGS